MRTVKINAPSDSGLCRVPVKGTLSSSMYRVHSGLTACLVSVCPCVLGCLLVRREGICGRGVERCMRAGR